MGCDGESLLVFWPRENPESREGLAPVMATVAAIGLGRRLDAFDCGLTL
jgi:hypothetical protein